MMMFKNGVDLDQALLDVREKVDQVDGILPGEAGDPNVLRFSPDELPVIWVSVTGKDAAAVTKIADEEIVPLCERKDGVASVAVDGTKDGEIQLTFNGAKIHYSV